jgi:phosphopantetheinyl transferase (holo-ACP synthase)
MIVGVGIGVVGIARLTMALKRTQGLAARLFTERERKAKTEEPPGPAGCSRSAGCSRKARGRLAPCETLTR